MFTITRNGLDAISKDLGVISNNIANATKCINVSGDKTGSNCPLPDNSLAWVIHFEKDCIFNNFETHLRFSGIWDRL